MANVNCLRCRFRHEDNGNCTAVGGFCTAVPAAHCPLLRQYLDTGMTPEEVLPKDKADEIALKLMCLADLESLCSYTRLRELAEADKNGRVVVLSRWKNEEERLERQRLMRIMADGAIDRLMKNPLKEKNGPDIAELRVVNTTASWSLPRRTRTAGSSSCRWSQGGRCSARSILSGRG